MSGLFGHRGRPHPLVREGEMLGFLVQWHLPDVNAGFGTSDDGDPAVFLVAPDGSEAFVETTAAHGGRYRVSQSGPRRLWDVVEQVHEFWRNADQPGYERFGVTATAAQQYVWLDDPDGPHRWPFLSC